MHTHVHAFLIFGLCSYYLKREGSVMFVVILCILFCGFCESIYMCALQYCRQVKSINEKFYFTVPSHDRYFTMTAMFKFLHYISYTNPY